MTSILLSFASAWAVNLPCGSGDAPAAYWNHQCDGVCGKFGGEWECDLQRLCTDAGGWAIVVSEFDGTGQDFSAWGECGTDNFCCAYTEIGAEDEITSVSMWGTEYDDTWLAFTDVEDPAHTNYLHGDGVITVYGQNGSLGLLPFDFYGAIHGRGGDDSVVGSVHASAFYWEEMYGEFGNDALWGMDSYDDGTSDTDTWDYMDGGFGDDTILGGGVLVGGPGGDTLYGDDDTNDLLCDSNGYGGGMFAVCEPDGADLFNGLGKRDTLWYEAYLGCSGALDGASTGGGAQDTCGNSDDFYTSDMPTSCEIYTDTKPALCP